MENLFQINQVSIPKANVRLFKLVNAESFKDRLPYQTCSLPCVSCLFAQALDYFISKIVSYVRDHHQVVLDFSLIINAVWEINKKGETSYTYKLSHFVNEVNCDFENFQEVFHRSNVVTQKTGHVALLQVIPGRNIIKDVFSTTWF